MKLATHGLYLIDASFRHVREPFGATLPTKPHPETELQIEVSLAKAVEPNRYVVKLNTRMDSPEAWYVVAVTYAVTLEIDLEGAAAPEDLDNRLMVTGATMAYPYCREIISGLTGKARFGAIWLR